MKVTLAYPWTDDQGKDHAPDTTVDVDTDVAHVLIQDGKARTADTKTTSSKKES